MKIYIINLANATVRYQRIVKQLEHLGLAYERIEAVNGQQLSEEDIKKYCDINAVQSNPTWLTRGAIGCALSHWNVYQKMVIEDIDVALILEDDMTFMPNFPQILQEAEKQIKENEVMLLYFQSFKEIIFSNHHKATLYQNHEIVYPSNLDNIGAAGAYIISKNIAKQLAERLLPIRAAADTWHYFHKIGGFEQLRCVIPFGAVSSFAESTIDYIKKDNLLGRIKTFLTKHNILFADNLLRWRRKRIWEKLTKYSFKD